MRNAQRVWSTQWLWLWLWLSLRPNLESGFEISIRADERKELKIFVGVVSFQQRAPSEAKPSQVKLDQLQARVRLRDPGARSGWRLAAGHKSARAKASAPAPSTASHTGGQHGRLAWYLKQSVVFFNYFIVHVHDIRSASTEEKKPIKIAGAELWSGLSRTQVEENSIHIF